MRTGGFPSRDEALREMLGKHKVSRRTFFAGCLACLGGGIGVGIGLDFGSQPGATTPATPQLGPGDPMFAWARELAGGPFEPLWRNRFVFISTVARNGRDRDLWRGVHRLALAAIDGDDEHSTHLARRLLTLRHQIGGPQYLEPVYERLARKRPR